MGANLIPPVRAIQVQASLDDEWLLVDVLGEIADVLRSRVRDALDGLRYELCEASAHDGVSYRRRHAPPT
jgi:hypothetical protein